MPGSISFGTWKIAPESVESTVMSALNAGFRSIDTAVAYANECGVGNAIKKSGIARSDLFISGKLWVSCRSYDAAMKACKKSLRHMGLDYFDQYLIHWPASPDLNEDADILNAETWGALEELVAEGVVASIGVCNFTEAELANLLESASIAPSINQIEMHPGYYPRELAAFCKREDIGVEAWSPLGHGSILEHPLLRQIADEYRCSVAQVCLKWCIERGATPIVGASSVAHMLEALGADGVDLSESKLAEVDGMEECGFSGMRSEVDVL